ncbi:SWIM zinc finger family protein [Streptomyces sp. NPDC020192]|uniref:SWIM zinc finger family protein n=1 Tax=Streptomyces sp. NPDC020192 TaxID=3365066 RepID=UPI0037B78FB1
MATTPAPDAAEEAAPGGGTEAPGGSAELAGESSARGGRRPADAVRAALRAAGAVPVQDGTAAHRPRPADATAPAHDGDPAPRPTPTPGGRPGDVAREALRAARREALRAEAEAGEAVVRDKRTAEPRVRRGPRPAGGSAGTVPHQSPAPGPDSRTVRIKAAQDMRHYLANAFRMPAWSDTPEEEPLQATGTGDHGHSDPSPSAPAMPEASPNLPASPTDPTEADQPVPASAHVPATMATPHRDTELRRTFPAFAPREGTADGASFAGTWWGNAWVGALEQGALDAKRVARGRGYAEQGHVDAITVTPGLVLAYVRGSRPRPYRVQVRVRTLEGDEWARFLDAAADRPGHIAALLDKELPESLADCGVPLLPGPGDLAPRCSCPDSGHPCKHAAALCYQTARLLDADPFVLLLLRGRGEKDLLDALSRRSAARAARAAQDRQPEALPGVRATDALAPRTLPPLPAPLPVPPHPEQPPVYPAAPGGPDPFALDQLATDAAARAHALLGTGRDPVGELTLWQDAVRLAAARPGSGLTATTRTLYAALATAAGRTPTDLARAVAAWRQGGSAGLAVLEEPWDPPAGRFDRARPLLLAADLPAFRPWRNRLTHPHGHMQLRLGRDGLWYAYESEPGRDDWWPRGTPDLDPVGALTGLGALGDR